MLGIPDFFLLLCDPPPTAPFRASFQTNWLSSVLHKRFVASFQGWVSAPGGLVFASFLLLDLDLVLQLIDLVEILRAFWSVFACLPTPTRG